jgi:hypothetical protein
MAQTSGVLDFAPLESRDILTFQEPMSFQHSYDLPTQAYILAASFWGYTRPRNVCCIECMLRKSLQTWKVRKSRAIAAEPGMAQQTALNVQHDGNGRGRVSTMTRSGRRMLHKVGDIQKAGQGPWRQNLAENTVYRAVH